MRDLSPAITSNYLLLMAWDLGYITIKTTESPNSYIHFIIFSGKQSKMQRAASVMRESVWQKSYATLSKTPLLISITDFTL